MRAAIVLAVLLAVAGADTAGAASRTLSVGLVDLTRCKDLPSYYCGSLSRPLDPAKPGGKRIRIAFRWRPATRGGRRVGSPIVAVEGGPGYPSTGSYAEFAATFGPLLDRRDLLLVDNRGTGRSALVDCPRVQRWSGATNTDRYARAVAGCARTIDRRHGRGAHDRFGTADAVDDLAAIVRRMRLPPVALYGDSYGSWFAQSFAARHPRALASVTLDSTYPASGLDPFYASSAATARDAFDAVCRRDPGCAAATAGLATTATDRLGQLVAQVRSAPIVGRRVRITPKTLVDLVQWAGTDPIVYRELDPSVRAALAGDTAPLVRLVAEATAWSTAGSPAAEYSEGLYAAVACSDYPQLFDLRSSPAARRRQLAAVYAPAEAFAPFALSEWLSMDNGSQPFTLCLDWNRGRVRPPVPARAPRLPAGVPLLVVGGDLDSLTPLRDARDFAPRIATRSRVVEVPNTTHVTSQGFTLLQDGARCARTVIRGFMRSPQRLERLDVGCTAGVPAVHTAGAYPRTLADAAAATVASGPDPGDAARRAVTVAAGAVADATARRSYAGENGGFAGLRGGSVRTRGGRTIAMTFRRARFTLDAAVSGTATWRPSTGAVSAGVTVTDELGTTTRVRLAWRQSTPQATARLGTTTLVLPAP